MDAADVEAITKIVKTVGAEFKGASDEDIKFWIELQAPVISRKKFGADYNLALATTRWEPSPTLDALPAYPKVA